MRQPSVGARKRVRMRDVAQRAGVSISTVSLVLSGDPRIPEDTTQKVLQTVKAMEYRPSVIARSLARRISRTIGVILPEIAFSKNQPFFYQALKGIHSETQPAGFKMVVEAVNKGFIERRYYLRILKEQSADGIIFLTPSVNDQFLQEMEKESYPFVLVGGGVKDVDLPSARGDDFGGAFAATEHLIKLGHKAIGHISGLTNYFLGLDRRKGYEEAMKKAGLPIDPAWIQEGESDAEKAAEAAGKLADLGVTAIFAANDVMAYGALQALRRKQKRVPEDIALVGMDDLEFSALTNPSLTTVRYDIEKISALAANFLLKQIQSPIIPKTLLEEVPPPQLIVRESCGGNK